MENVTKSIIYGNAYENRYGKFLPVCSSISDRCISDFIQLQFSISWIIYMILLTSSDTTEWLTPIELSKCRWSSSRKRKMWKINIIKGVIVMKQ